ncbi:MAG: DUF6287 domain-containing protein [Oscillospiraceae bacterium]|nr:DUF6287 domain-containing protein [Oscillospiraceae bacterium]
MNRNILIVIAIVLTIALGAVAIIILVLQNNNEETVVIDTGQLEEATARYEEIVTLASKVNQIVDEKIAEAQEVLEGEPDVGENRAALQQLETALENLIAMRIEISERPETVDEIDYAIEEIEGELITLDETLLENLGEEEILIFAEGSAIRELFEAIDTAIENIHLAVQAEENRRAEEVTRQGLENLLRRDFSYIAGTWRNEQGTTITISNDGRMTWGEGWSAVSLETPQRHNNAFHWTVGDADNYDSRAIAVIYPVGVPMGTYSPGSTTDTTRIRFFVGQSAPEANEVYYRYGEQ